ncbi:lysozyme inhibitor LprI family protein [Erwinia sp. ErVv1]|uniref:lysozyme inhibitor LprI family protein n=1 Tax=Erwinia sp. ErVv1 TaxID=1603299 RepID=UPI000836BBC5|nr:lysozyme inhibitor LprI family protein [Erwinia sp. ErVv1]
MKYTMRLLLGFTVLSLSTSVFAADACLNPQAEGEILQCSAQKKVNAENLLNKEYSSAKQRIMTTYKADKSLGDEYIKTLLDAQRGWLKYRDAQCKLEAFVAEEGTLANTVSINECIARVDGVRIKDLKSMPY